MKQALLVIIAGIAAGRFLSLPCSNACLAYLLLFLLALTAILHRRDRIATVIAFVSLFVTGVFLIRYNDSHGDISIPLMHAAESFFSQQRTRLSMVYEQMGMEGDDYGIVAAMTLGEKWRVSRELREVYSVSGGAHVFALSGLHLGILFMLLSVILPQKRLPRLSRIIQIVVLWLFVLLVGAHPSVMRAALMLTLYTIARWVSADGRNTDILALTALLLLVACPQWLFDIGCQMSFLAVLSIMLCYMPVYSFVTFHPTRAKAGTLRARWYTVKDALWSVPVVSLVAQLGVAPLIAFYFGRFSTYFLLTNMIVSPCAFLVIALAMAILTLSFLPLTSGITAILTTVLLVVVHLMNGALKTIANLPYSSIDSIQLSVWQVLLVYVIILSVILLVRLFVRRTDRYAAMQLPRR